MFVSLLLLRKKADVHTTEWMTGIASFGFKEQGTYEISFSGDAPMLIVGLANSTEWKSIVKQNITDSASKYIENYNLSAIYKVLSFNTSSSSELYLNGTISVKDAYTLYVFSFDMPFHDIKYSAVFTNQNGLLDYRYENLLITAPIFLATIGILTGLWLFNWFRNFNVQIYIHYIFTAVFILAFLNDFAYYIYIVRANKSDTDLIPFIFCFLTYIIKDIVFSFAIILAASGWCILIDSIKIKELIICIILSALFIGAKIVNEFCSFTGPAAIATGIIFTVSLIVYATKLVQYTHTASTLIFAHMLAIKNAGIDPTTTPVQKKLAMYVSFEFILIGYCLTFLIKFCVDEFAPVGWYGDFTDQLLDTIILYCLAFIFRIRDKDNNGYSVIEENMEKVDDLQLSEIEAVSQNEADLHNGIEWRPGMQLPGRPNIIREPVQQQITLESPDGEQSLTATSFPNDQIPA